MDDKHSKNHFNISNSEFNKIGLIFSVFPGFLDPLNDYGFKIAEGMRKVSKIKRAIRKLHYKSHLPGFQYWFSKELNQLQNCNIIIIFTNQFTFEILKYLKKKYPTKKYIMWFWNPISKSINPNYLNKFPDVVKCSFDPNDSKQYNLKFVETFTLLQPSTQNIQTHPKHDIYFVGQDKGRLPLIKKLQEVFSNMHLTTLFQVIKDKNSGSEEFNYSNYVPYTEIIKNIHESNCILDVVQKDQYGLTQRVFESYVFNKILITNSKSIINSQIYDPNRIFILDHDDINTLPKMIKAQRPDIDKDILAYYSVESWINRLLN